MGSKHVDKEFVKNFLDEASFVTSIFNTYINTGGSYVVK
jgi:hypothetical protein